MKLDQMKSTFLILIITFSTNVVAQKNYQSNQIVTNEYVSTEEVSVHNSSSGSIEKTVGQVVWSNNFSTPSDWVINNSGQTSSGYGWDIGPTESSWFFSSVINSTSDGNFAELGNGDPTIETQATDITYTLTTADPINIFNLAGTSMVNLNFLQYGARFNDVQEVYISIDGTTWIKVGDNSDIQTYSSSGGSPYANPTLKTINLSNALNGSSATSVWIKFSWTSQYADLGSNPDYWVTYGWMIDDVNISTLSDNNLTLINPSIRTGIQELTYSKIPLNQISPISFTADIINKGTNALTNIQMEVLVAGGSTFSSIDTLLSASDTMVSITTTYTPECIISTKTFNYSVASSDFEEDEPFDNIGSGSLSITSSIYSVHNGIKTGTISSLGGSNSGLPLKIGNLMEIMSDDILESITIKLGNKASNVGQEFLGEIWIYNGTEYEFIGSTDYKTIYSNINNTTVTLPLIDKIPVYAGDLLLVLACNNGGTEPVDFGYAQKLSTGSVLGIHPIDNSIYSLSNPSALMVSLNMNPLILTSSTTSTNQNVCLNSPIEPITYFVASGISISSGSLPLGVTGMLNGNLYTISGTPTSSVGSPFNFTLTSTGGNCDGLSLGGSISINEIPNISLTSSIETTNQTICVNTALTPITCAVTNGSFISVDPLPVGISASIYGGELTISGTSTSSVGGVYNYTVQSSIGSCYATPLTGIINVNSNSSISLISESGTNSQTVLVNSPITDITYIISANTAFTTNALPAGITESFNSGVFTISGTPTSSIGSPFTYTISTVDGICGDTSTSGTITVNEQSGASIKKNKEFVFSIANLYPNPTTGQTSISYTLENESAVSIKVMDITGKTVYTSNEVSQSEGVHKKSLDVSNYATGVYYVTISTNGAQVTKKLIKK